MKRCPECRRDYFDDSLLYCLDDGTTLLDGPGADEPATAILQSVWSETRKLSGNLPAERTRFVGRTIELDDCVQLLGDTRLVNITGFGGCGKTRLAIKIAETVIKDFPDGAWFMDLGLIVDENMIEIGRASCRERGEIGVGEG